MLLGAGAGLVAVFLLKKYGLSQKAAQANALAVMFPISIVSLIIYFKNGYVKLQENIFLFPFSVLGAVFGTAALGKISDRAAKLCFGVFLLWSGIRLLTK
jgi:uncharacterized membrane protein YfcA